MEIDKGRDFAKEIRKIAIDGAARNVTARVVRNHVASGRLQTPEQIEGFSQRVHSVLIQTDGASNPERDIEIRGLIDQGIAEGLIPQLSTPGTGK